jgi:hypothetical protein
MSRGKVLSAIGLSVLVLLPCYWQSRIQAGDLSSHIYNAWLAVQIERQPIHGLSVVSQWTNIVFDWALTGLLRQFGPDWAQRLSVSVCVLIFFWGSFFLVRTLAGRVIWPLTPLLMMLSYGWLFHSGFFNFYFSMGICFFVLAFWLRRRSVREMIFASLLLPLAFLGHALPIVWTVAVVIFLSSAHRFPRLAFPVTVVLLALMGFWLKSLPSSYSSYLQITNMTGFDQLGVFTSTYLRLAIVVLAIVGFLLWRLMRQVGGINLIRSPEAQLTALLSLAMLLIPISIPVPGKTVLLGMLPMRLSVTVAIFVLGLVGKVSIPRWVLPALTACLLVFGWMVYRDTSEYNRLEDKLTTAIEQNARGQRVVMAVRPLTHQDYLQIDLATHLIDRACVGRCFSYANYEPTTGVFRIRATVPNAAVMMDYGDSLSAQYGDYRATARDLPLLQAHVCGLDRPIRIEAVHEGEIVGTPHCDDK